MDLKKICRGCFREKPEAGGVCPYCGFDEIKYERERDPEVLPLNTVLQGKYVIGRCLGRGGFGITYMGWHANLQTVVAIKEFFPSGIVSRNTGSSDRTTRSDVTMVNTGSTKAYRKSLDGFIKEARTLGGLRLPGVVLVHDFFEENRTAYIIMDYVEGENLSLWLKHSGGKLPEAQVLKLIRPLTGSLQKLHEKGIIHRDISPDNLILQPDGSIMLVDFGAARTVVLEQEAEKAVQSMTVVLKPGYAPIEQYNSHGHQGPWTDVYAFCATIFRMLTGAAPTDPSTRAVRDDDEEMLRASLESTGVSQKTINALMKGMQLRPQNRCQNMWELEKTLYGAEEVERKDHTGERGTQQPQVRQNVPENEPVKICSNTDEQTKENTVICTTKEDGQGSSRTIKDEVFSQLSDSLAEQIGFVMGDEGVKNSAVKEQCLVLICGSDFNEQLKKLSGSYKESFSDIDEIIESIIFTDAFAPVGVETVSLSETGDLVTAWFDQGSRSIFISTQANRLYLNGYSDVMFCNFAGLKNLDMSIFDTSSVTSMFAMFEGCSRLVSLDLSSFDTSSVTDMSSMFEGCSRLVSLDLSSFDTSSVTDMSSMFEGCNRLVSLDLSSFDTSFVTDMSFMFEHCSSLTEVISDNLELLETYASR